ncbi:hypothetical protein XA68_10355 [Ophiocordyceps unilateralis]|uniref:ER membrane protein complex subunit 6 n=1 Tax=Ophiocordyceps unilateralis TaxID=268505 RepID=A0A2A9P0C0_OPHUN|nr:hypothetical protein XA68_10355 [Ophiocordyceps unilateralis]
MRSERVYQLCPIVQDSIIHNSKTLANLHNLAASIFGVCAGILGLESYSGFLFYIVLSITITFLFYAMNITFETSAERRIILDSSRYFRAAFNFWTSGIATGLSGFILTWTLFYGLVST